MSATTKPLDEQSNRNPDQDAEPGTHKLWGGRFTDELSPIMEQFNASISFDRRMWKEDIDASLVYSKHLKLVRLLSEEEHNRIADGLTRVADEWRTGSLRVVAGDEDVHSVNERRLKELIGFEVGGKLHVGRSRNDQVATDMRLWLRSGIRELRTLMASLISRITSRAEAEVDILMPGYTHLQRAQPVLWSHWLLSYAWTFQQDCQHLDSVLACTNICPLGSGAIAGNPFPIDREVLARDLGFSSASHNSMQAVADRDFVARFLFWCSLTSVHLSRLAEDLVIYGSQEFSFVKIADQFSTGSSLMPQKKNADSLELIRGKTGRLVGNATGLLVVLKGLPSTFNKDMQEDKEGMFDSFDTIKNMILITEGVISTLTVNVSRCAAALSSDMFATDIAYWLVRRGMAFREAHEISGRVVSRAEELKCDLTQIPVEELRTISPKFTQDIESLWNYRQSIEQYAGLGGTSEQSVMKQIHELGVWLQGWSTGSQR